MGAKIRLAAGLLAAGLAVGPAAGALTACTSPESAPTEYRAEARRTLEAATGHVATAELALQALLDGRMFATSADDTVSTAEHGLDGTVSAFVSLQPPRGSDVLRDDVSQVLAEAQDAVSDARIAIRRNDSGAEAAALEALTQAADRIDTVTGSW